LLVLAAARPELHEAFPGLWGNRAAQEIRLGELTPKASERLVQRTLGPVLGQALAPELTQRLVARSGGNAFFLEELIRAAAEGRADVLPDSILAIVQARLEALPPDARQVLRAASVFGETAWRGGLARLVDASSVSSLDAALSLLEEQELVVRRIDARFLGETELALRHAFVREAAYATLTADDKRLGHRLAAEWLEEKGEQQPLVLAEHHERGDEPARAVDWYVKAARQAAGIHLAAVIRAAEHGVACGAQGEARGELRYWQAEAYFFQGDLAAAQPCIDEAIPLLRRGTAMWCTSVGGLTVLGAQSGAFDAVAPQANLLLTTEPEAGARVDYARSMMACQFMVRCTGRPDVAERFLARHEDMGRLDRDDLTIRGTLHLARAFAARMRDGDPWAAAEAAGSARDCFLEIGSSGFQAWSARELGWAWATSGALEKAAALVTAALDEAWSHQLHLFTPFLGALSAWLSARRGLGEEARREAERARAGAAQLGPELVFSLASLATIARTELLLGDLAAAARMAREVLARAQGAQYRATALAVVSRIALAAGQPEPAQAAAREAADLLRAEPAAGYDEPFVALALHDALRAAGHADEALQAARAATERIQGIAALAPDPVARDAFLSDPERSAMVVLGGGLRL
jgi:ATP/maltotriose-dependent transcriptional regulator MalT